MQTPQSCSSKLLNSKNNYSQSQKANKEVPSLHFDRKLFNFQSFNVMRKAFSGRQQKTGKENTKRKQKLSIQLKVNKKANQEARKSQNLYQKQSKGLFTSVSTEQCSQKFPSKQGSNKKVGKQRSISIKTIQARVGLQLHSNNNFLNFQVQDKNWDQLIQDKKTILYAHLYNIDKKLLLLSYQDQSKQNTTKKKINLSKKQNQENEVQPIKKQDMINLIRKKCQENKNKVSKVQEIAVDLRKHKKLQIQVIKLNQSGSKY